MIKEQKEEQERMERGREVMSRCLNAAGRKDVFKGFNHWKRVSLSNLNGIICEIPEKLDSRVDPVPVDLR